jgi:hypothetical protein
MFLSDKLCFIELEKTAVNYIRETFQANINNGKIIGAHNFINENLVKKKLLFVGSVRNPYDWYISRWSYGCFRQYNDSLYKNFLKKRLRLSRNQEIKKNNIKKINFFFNQLFKSSIYWKKLYENSNDPKNFRIWLKSFLDSEKSKDLAEHYYFSSLFKKFGYLTFKYLLMFTNPNNRQMLFDGSIATQNDIQIFDKKNNYINKFIKFETLDNDIDNILKILGVNFNERLDKLNVSKRVTETDFYFDTEIKDLVWKYDEYIFQKHKYKY